MFKTFQGVTEDSTSTLYLRPETAQGIFVKYLTTDDDQPINKERVGGIGSSGKKYFLEIKMLNKEEITKIREKMEKTKTYSATFARRLGISRQAINIVLNGKCTSQRVEDYLKNWLISS